MYHVHHGGTRGRGESTEAQEKAGISPAPSESQLPHLHHPFMSPQRPFQHDRPFYKTDNQDTETQAEHYEMTDSKDYQTVLNTTQS